MRNEEYLSPEAATAKPWRVLRSDGVSITLLARERHCWESKDFTRSASTKVQSVPGLGSNDAVYPEMISGLKVLGGILCIYSKDSIRIQWIGTIFRIGVKIVGSVGEPTALIDVIESTLRVCDLLAGTPIAYFGWTRSSCRLCTTGFCLRSPSPRERGSSKEQRAKQEQRGSQQEAWLVMIPWSFLSSSRAIDDSSDGCVFSPCSPGDRIDEICFLGSYIKYKSTDAPTSGAY